MAFFPSLSPVDWVINFISVFLHGWCACVCIYMCTCVNMPVYVGTFMGAVRSLFAGCCYISPTPYIRT